MNEDVRKLRITSSMSLEQAMLEVRRYLEATSTSAGKQVSRGIPNHTGMVRSAQFDNQAAMAGHLAEIAARLGEVEPYSKLGALGVFLKRVVRKAIAWYSRPEHEFDRAALELLRQIRLDMLGLQQQIAALQEQASSGMTTAAESRDPQSRSIQDRSPELKGEEALSLMIELFKNITAVQAFRRALRDEDPELLRRVGTLLEKTEAEAEGLKSSLMRSLQAEK